MSDELMLQTCTVCQRTLAHDRGRTVGARPMFICAECDTPAMAAVVAWINRRWGVRARIPTYQGSAFVELTGGGFAASNRWGDVVFGNEFPDVVGRLAGAIARRLNESTDTHVSAETGGADAQQIPTDA